MLLKTALICCLLNLQTNMKIRFMNIMNCQDWQRISKSVVIKWFKNLTAFKQQER